MTQQQHATTPTQPRNYYDNEARTQLLRQRGKNDDTTTTTKTLQPRRDISTTTQPDNHATT